jgi:Putative Flp pilus-assembly TadE/G-like
MKYPRLARRRGNILGMTLVLMVVLIAFVALAVDVGFLYTMRAELQRTADAAAIAACWELIDQDGNPGAETTNALTIDARNKATQFAGLNKVGNDAPGLATEDVKVGYIADPGDPNQPMVSTPAGKLPNSVYVRVQRTNDQNGQVSLFFARAIGLAQQSIIAEATAAVRGGVIGWKMPGDGTNLGILPFALDVGTWDNLATFGTDTFSYNSNTKTVSRGPDGINEVNLYPDGGTGMPGNRGTIDIGNPANSTSDLERQVLYGLNADDLSYMGGTIQFNDDGVLPLQGDTGISAGLSDELLQIVGQPRILPLFNNVVGPGNNAQYSIVRWVGVRVMAVKLSSTAANKYVVVQPCNVVMKGGVYSTTGESVHGGDYIFSPVWLCR